MKVWRKCRNFGVQSRGTGNKYRAFNFETYQRDVCPITVMIKLLRIVKKILVTVKIRYTSNSVSLHVKGIQFFYLRYFLLRFYAICHYIICIRLFLF